MIWHHLLLSVRISTAIVCCITFIPLLVVVFRNSSTHANCKVLLVLSAVSQQIMLVSQVFMFAYEIYIENSKAENEIKIFWFITVHDCCYFTTTYLAILILIERLFATNQAESYETRPVNKTFLSFLITFGIVLSIPFSYVIHALYFYFPTIVFMSIAESVVIALSLKVYRLTTQRITNLPYNFDRVTAKYQLEEVLQFTRALILPIIISAVLKTVALVPPTLWKLDYITYPFASTIFFPTHAVNCVLMKATMICLHKGMRRTLFASMGISRDNRNAVMTVVPKTSETNKYFQQLQDAWA